MNFIEHLVRRCGQMNDVFIPLQLVRLCWYTYCTTDSYVPHTPVTPLRRRRRPRRYSNYTTRLMNSLTHRYARMLHTCRRCSVFFMNENLTVYEPCGWFLFALVLRLAFYIPLPFFAIPNIRSIARFFHFSRLPPFGIPLTRQQSLQWFVRSRAKETKRESVENNKSNTAKMSAPVAVVLCVAPSRSLSVMLSPHFCTYV